MDQLAIISTDIVAHATAPHAVQRDRVEAINRMVRSTLSRPDVRSSWASGGDGGHVLFLSPDWQSAAADLVVRLWQWADDERVPLRITAHAGHLERMTGADGGTQFVGDAINTAGRLLELAVSMSVVATEEFRAAFDSGATSTSATFHDPRWVNLRQSPGRLLLLMSFPPRLQSHWPSNLQGDDALLEKATADRDGWTVIYRAKRLMQANTNSRKANVAIRRLSASQLRSGTPSAADEEPEPNPILGSLDAPSRVELVRIAQLVERKSNDVICGAGDDGDIMFVLLSGEVGIVMPPPSAEASAQSVSIGSAPALTLTAGDIVGELAFALERPRTASVVAKSDVALLAFRYAEVDSRLRDSPFAREALTRVDRFMTERVLEHLYDQAPGLVPADPTDDPNGDVTPRRSLENTAACTTVIKLDAQANVSLDALAAVDQIETGGVYILASGSLRSSSLEHKRVEADSYRLLYVDLPGMVVTPDHEYIVERRAVIVHIAQPAILALDPTYQNEYVLGLRRQVRDCYQYDAFLSYAFHDSPIVDRWEEAMRARGLHIFRDQPRVGYEFPALVEAALADSLAVVVFVSANTLVRPPEENWVRREVEFRERLFEKGAAVIVPVTFFGGNPAIVAGGHSPVDATGDEEQALTRIIETISRIREGSEDGPFGRSRVIRQSIGRIAPQS